MKTICFAAFIALSCIACNQPVKGKNGVLYKSPVEYNDFIVNRQTMLMRNVIEFSSQKSNNLDTAEMLLRKYARQAEQMIIEIKGMPAYRGDSSLRDAAVRSFTFYKRLFDTDYMEILDIRRKGEDSITAEDVTRANNLVERLRKEEESYDEAFHAAQEAYARRHNMKLLENKAQEELDQLDKNK